MLLCHVLWPKKCTRIILCYFSLKCCALSISLSTTKSQSLRQTKFTSNKTNLVSGSRTIIDEIILFCGNLDAILIELECVCKYFLKYRFSFRLDRCDFLETRVKYVCHEIIKAVNFPALLKFDPINNCILPFTGQSLFCFIVPVNFYHIYAPYFEIWSNP